MADPQSQTDLGLVFGGDAEATEEHGRRHLLLRQLDRATPEPLFALAREPYELNVTFAAPVKVACSNGQIYWLKARAQSGLVVELIMGRLGEQLGSAPETRIVEVPAIVLRNDPRLERFEGAVVGVRHLRDTVSTREIAALIGRGLLDPPLIDHASRALTIAAQTWFNLEDAQVRVSLRDGKVYSVDHGFGLDARLAGRPTRIVVATIPGVSPDIGRDWTFMAEAVGRIKGIGEAAILEAVAAMPDDSRWQGAFARRLAIAEWLIRRQEEIGEVMHAWCRRLS